MEDMEHMKLEIECHFSGLSSVHGTLLYIKANGNA